MNSNSFSLPQEHHEAEQTTKVDILRTGHKKNCFLITIYQFSMLKVSPLRMVQTGETVPPDKHVRIKFHQTGPSRVVKLTPTARDTDCFSAPVAVSISRTQQGLWHTKTLCKRACVRHAVIACLRNLFFSHCMCTFSTNHIIQRWFLKSKLKMLKFMCIQYLMELLTFLSLLLKFMLCTSC